VLDNHGLRGEWRDQERQGHERLRDFPIELVALEIDAAQSDFFGGNSGS
jgi:hypothetical protein